MKRLALSLLFALSATAAAARGIIVVEQPAFGGTGDSVGYVAQANRKLAYFTGSLDSWGAEYDIIRADAVRSTESLRTGSVGSAYSWGIVFDFHGSRRDRWGLTYTDSLTLTYTGVDGTKGPRIPWLFVYTNLTAQFGIYSFYDNTTSGSFARACTTGVRGPRLVTADSTMVRLVSAQLVEGLYSPASGSRFIASSYIGAVFRNPTSPAGGLRVHIARSMNALSRYTMLQGVNARQPDSCGVLGGTPDSMVFWERPMSHLSGAKPLLFVYYAGGADLEDSVVANAGAGTWTNCEGEEPVLLAAVARLDSISGRDIIKRPLRLGVTLEGVSARGGRRNPFALYVTDSSTVWSSVDSLAVLHIPAVALVRSDSAATYPSDIVQLKSRWPELRFTPSTLTRSGRESLRSLVGSSRLSGLLIPPSGCDFSGLTAAGQLALADSAKARGFSAVRFNSQWNRSHYPNGIGSESLEAGIFNGVRFVGYGGNNLSGGALQWDVRADSTAPYVSCYISSNASPIAYEQARWWHGLTTRNNYIDFDFIPFNITAETGICNGTQAGPDVRWLDVNRPLADRIFFWRRANVIRMGLNDLGGDPSGPPARWGWWALKSMDSSMRIINALAGRTVVGWAYPEDLNP